MRPSGATLAVAASLTIALVCAGLVAWRLVGHAPSERPAPAPAAGSTEAPAPQAAKPAKPSTMIDLPGDPVLVQRGAVTPPRELTVGLPIKIAADAPRSESRALYFSSPLLSTTGGYMGKFPAGGQEADDLAAQLAMNATAIAEGGEGGGQSDAGFDDDGGDATPENAADLILTQANSGQLEITPGGANGRPQLRQVVLKPLVAEKIGDLLIANGYSEESARDVEGAAKEIYNVQTLQPGALAVATGTLDQTGAYRVAQLAIYENRDYVGSIALAENGKYGDGAEPALPADFLSDTAGAPNLAARFTLADGLYSAGLRNGMPEAVIREAVQLLGRVADLRAPLTADETMRALFARDFRSKSRTTGKIIYVGLAGSAGVFDCYAFEGADGEFRCFDAKGGGASPAAPGPKTLGTPTPPARLGESGATSVGGILAPIKGAPVTSLFGMRFHPILHILRLHGGIDFGAAVGSPVRAAADGKVEIAGPVSGFGNHVRIQHKGFETSYSHLSEIPTEVKPGAEVHEGQIIALSGNTGLSTGPHLHFEFYIDGKVVDPLPHLGTEVQVAAGTGATSAPVAAAAAVAASAPAAASQAEIAAFATVKSLVDAALETASK